MRIALVAALIAASAAAHAQAGSVPAGDIPPIERDYRGRIVAWTKRFFREPALVRLERLSDPVATRDSQGRLFWLVCLEAVATGPDGRPMPAERHAFGFAPDYMSAPLERNGSSLERQECDRPSLTWRPFAEAARRR